MQRDGNDQRPQVFAAGSSCPIASASMPSQHGRSRHNVVVFQEMDQPAQRSGILAKRDGAVEFRLEIAASLAASIAHQQLRRQQALAALHTLRRTNGLDGIQTLLAHGKTRNVYEGDTTEPAIGGEENGKNAAYYRNNWRDEGRTLLGALSSSLSI